MMVEKVPDSTYEMIGGLDKQIKEIKEVNIIPYSLLENRWKAILWYDISQFVLFCEMLSIHL